MMITLKYKNKNYIQNIDLKPDLVKITDVLKFVNRAPADIEINETSLMSELIKELEIFYEKIGEG